MKNLQKGFIVPVLLVIIALLVVGGGVYIYESKKSEAPAVVDTGTQQSNQQQTNTQAPPTTQQNSSVGTNKVSIKLLSPNGGENFKIGDKVSIRWTSTNNINKKVMIGLTAKDGNTIVKEITNYLDGISDTGSYSWTVDSSILPGTYRIVVQTSERPQYAYDASDAPFSISASTTNFLGNIKIKFIM
ncbi:MAG: Ser-Thr-rich GPI-anchored membrane family protein [bacterium]